MAFPGPRYYSIRVFSSNTAKKLRMLPVTATADRPAGRSLSWSPGLLTASLLLISVLVSLWLVSPVFWDRLGGDSRAFYAAARLEGTGGDPYNFAQLTAEESRIDAAAGPPSAASGYSANPYHYPPAMTRAWEAFVPLGDRGFYWSNFAILLALGLLGMELILVALAWRNRWLVRVLLVVSPATTLVLVSGNPSTLLLAAWGGALLGGVPEPRHPGGESFGGRLDQAPGWHPGGGGGAGGRPRPQAHPGRQFRLGDGGLRRRQHRRRGRRRDGALVGIALRVHRHARPRPVEGGRPVLPRRAARTAAGSDIAAHRRGRGGAACGRPPAGGAPPRPLRGRASRQPLRARDADGAGPGGDPLRPPQRPRPGGPPGPGHRLAASELPLPRGARPLGPRLRHRPSPPAPWLPRWVAVAPPRCRDSASPSASSPRWRW